MAADAAVLRNGLTELTTLADRDLMVLWQQIRTAAEAQEALADVLPALLDTYGAGAETLAAEWYEMARLEAGVAGNVGAVVRPGSIGAPYALAQWGTEPLTAAVVDWDAALARLTGGMQRTLWDAARKVVMDSTSNDYQAYGWQRIANPGACGFCVMLESRGGVYTESSVNFGSHNNCGCTATPAWKNKPTPVKPYTPSERQATQADRDRTRLWIKQNVLPEYQ